MRIYGLRENFIPIPRDDPPRTRAPREMHDATCAECGKQCQVPFKPDESRPVYCGECYQKHRPIGASGRSGRR